MEDHSTGPHQNSSRSRQATRILRLIFLTLVIINLAVVFYKFISADKADGLTVAEMEALDPKHYLITAGTYTGPFDIDSITIKGSIQNNATAATYKDPVVRITYYNKRTGPVLTRIFTASDIFPPRSKKPFSVTVASYDNIALIDWEIMNASVK